MIIMDIMTYLQSGSNQAMHFSGPTGAEQTV